MIPFFDYRPEYRAIEVEVDAAVKRVLESGQLILGPEVDAFENEFAAFNGVAHSVGVATGTDAIVLALQALEIGCGDEVVVPSNAGVPPVAAIRLAAATPLFVDVDPTTLTLDPRAVEVAIGPQTKAILAVHLYGNPCDLVALQEIAERHQLHLIEDVAQAHGARVNGRRVGSWGVLGCFSFYPTKNLGAFGDGGAVVTDDAALADRLRRLRMYGFEPGIRYAATPGDNSRLDEMQAAMLRVKLARLDTINAERRRLASRYEAMIDERQLLRPRTIEGAERVDHLAVVCVEDRDQFRSRCEQLGVQTAVHYDHPVHTMEGYREPARCPGELPVTRDACSTVVSLPLYPGVDERVFERVAQAFRR